MQTMPLHNVCRFLLDNQQFAKFLNHDAWLIRSGKALFSWYSVLNSNLVSSFGNWAYVDETCDFVEALLYIFLFVYTRIKCNSMISIDI